MSEGSRGIGTGQDNQGFTQDMEEGERGLLNLFKTRGCPIKVFNVGYQCVFEV